MTDPNAFPARPVVRVRPMDLPREMHADAVCAQCEKQPPSLDVFVVFVDRARDAKDQVRAQPFLACSQVCAVELEAGLTVEHAILGVQEVRSTAAATTLAGGGEVPDSEFVVRDEDGYEVYEPDDEDGDATIINEEDEDDVQAEDDEDGDA